MPWENLDEDISEELGHAVFDRRALWIREGKNGGFSIEVSRAKQGALWCVKCGGSLPEDHRSTRRLCEECSNPRSTHGKKGAPQAKLCGRCGRPMVARRSTRKWCSRKCANSANNAVNNPKRKR